jgi:hypothetical protein
MRAECNLKGLKNIASDYFSSLIALHEGVEEI